MKSLFEDLDKLIEQAVASATNTERSLQKKQEKSIKERGIEAEKSEASEKSEADEDDKSEKNDDESAKKIKGKDPESGAKTKDSKNSGAEVPGTKTSKKLNDPSEKTITNPQFDDIKSKVNALRGSGSLTDEKVSGSVKDYLSKLSNAEKSALLTYLTNLSQIMASVKSAKQVKDPSKVGIKTSFSGKLGKTEDKNDKKSSTEPEKRDAVIVVGGK